VQPDRLLESCSQLCGSYFRVAPQVQTNNRTAAAIHRIEIAKRKGGSQIAESVAGARNVEALRRIAGEKDRDSSAGTTFVALPK